MFLFCFTKILNQAFCTTHTFDSEVFLHSWLLWPTVRRLGDYSELTWHLSAPHKGISKRTYLLKPSKEGSPEFQAVFSLLCRSFSLSINPRLVIMSSTLGSFANYVDKILTFIDPPDLPLVDIALVNVIMETLHNSSTIYIRSDTMKLSLEKLN